MTVETIEQFTFKQYQERERALLKRKEQIISQLPVGTMLFKGNTIFPERFQIVSQDKGYTEVQQYVWDRESSFGYAATEAPTHRLKIEGVFGYSEGETVKFFTQNPIYELKVLGDERLREHITKTSDKERLDLMTYGSFFNIINFDKFNANPILGEGIDYYEIYRKKIPRIYGPIGYWDFGFTSNCFSENNKEWKINFFGRQMNLSEEEMKRNLLDLLNRVLTIDKTDLRKLNEFELLSYYTLKGLQVQRNYMTMETTFKNPFSTKQMHIQFDELYDYDQLLNKWTKFSKVDGEYKGPNERTPYKSVSVKSKYAAPGTSLQPFTIPEGSLFVFDKSYANQLSDHLYYQVKSDDGKNVTLQAVERPNVYTKILKPIENIGLVTAPRRIVTIVKLPKQFGDSKRQELIDIPYALPTNQQPTSDQIFLNQSEFEMNLTREEKVQMMIYDKYAFDKRILEALNENDMVAIKTVMDELSKAPVLIDRRSTLGLNEYMIYREFVNMYCAIQAKDENDMTLAELMLAYRIKGKTIRYCGHPTHFIINEQQTVHSTKYDIFNI